MRKHFLRMMKLKSNKQLPESHVEGAILPPNSPMRFVWDKTPKQSPHNANMKKRFLAHFLEKHRQLYKDVPEKAFADKKALESSFDQAFTTLRQRYRAQKDASAAVHAKLREDQKGVKQRRIHRKKAKVASRTEIKKRSEAFSHPTFDSTLMQDCMSSEESCDERDDTPPTGTLEKVQVLRVRGLPWRSHRLLRFYAILDEQERREVEFGLKNIRRISKKDRCAGEFKDISTMPPKGVASWMISRRWVKQLSMYNEDLLKSLEDLVVDPAGFDWDQYDVLGVETEDEMDDQERYIPRSDTSYSLANALSHV